MNEDKTPIKPSLTQEGIYPEKRPYTHYRGKTNITISVPKKPNQTLLETKVDNSGLK